MRRRTVHAVFAVLGGACLAMAAVEGVRLMQALSIARQVRAAEAGAPIPAGARGEVRLAHALGLAQRGEADAAIRDYKHVIQDGGPTARHAAQLDLGNLELRGALDQEAHGQGADATPLVELAKQSYRDLLRDEPGDWDARYNLERALRLAPEVDEQPAEELSNPPTRERSISTLQGARIDLP